MFKKFRTITGDVQNTRYLAAEHLPSASSNLPSKQIFHYSNFKKIPNHIVLLFLFFTLFGLVNMYSISLTKGVAYFQKFMIFWIAAFITIFVLPLINIRYFLKLANMFYLFAVASLIGVLLVGDTSMGARRWLDIGFMRFQPSELAKFAIIFVIARHYHFIKQFECYSLIGAGKAFLYAIMPFVLIAIQPDLGSALIVLFISCIMIFVNGIRWRWLLIGLIFFVTLTPFAWHKLHDYQKNRILTFIDPESDPYGAGYNVIQSKIAIGSGGFLGKGYMNNDQSSLKFLPENQTDFAFTVFAEEFGFIGSILLLGLYMYLISYGVTVSYRSASYFGKMIAIGVTSFLFLHISINLMMITGLLPVVGIPLPFISYGGTFLLSCATCLGVLINVDINRNTVIQSSTRTYMLK